MRYPPAHRSDHVDIYKSLAQGEVKVHDPYNWLEKSSVDTDRWVDAQVSLSRAFLDCNPERQKLEKQFTQNMDYVKVCPCSLSPCTTQLSAHHDIVPSSTPPNAKAMAVGIGTTILGCRLSRCSIDPSIRYFPISPTSRILKERCSLM
jgi:hypothetical protein